MTSSSLSQLLEVGEFIKGAASPIDHAQLALPWIAEVKRYVYEEIEDSGLAFEAKRILGDLVHSSQILVGDRMLVVKIVEGLKQISIYERELNVRIHQQNTGRISFPNQPIGRGLVLSTTFDQYTLGDVIGEGGAGRVFEAQTIDGKSVAIKVLNAKAPIDKIKRFKNEIGFCQRDIHRGIIKIIDHGVFFSGDEKHLFYVMPKFPGTFRKHMSSISSEAYVRTIFQILEAIEAAHLYKCYHRDLKPENMLVDDQGNIVITDFGIAHFEEEDLTTAIETKHQSRLANFEYAAPEQRRKGSGVDHRADIYALGLIINEMFTGVVPVGSSFKTIALVNQDFQYLDDVVNKMISQDPNDRFQNIEQVKTAISLASKEQISYQKINSLTNTVISSEDISSNPLVVDPIRIVKCNYEAGSLICTVNHDIPAVWFDILRFYRGASTYSNAVHWQFLNYSGRDLIYGCPMQNAKHCKAYIEEWIDNTNKLFHGHLLAEASRAFRDRKEKIERELEYERGLTITLKELNS